VELKVNDLQSRSQELSVERVCQVDVHREGFTPANAKELASAYDVIVDATDNAASRYLISDACVIAGRPLVSGAALGTDGQLTVYNYGPDGARFTIRCH
jgi:adenylyltransferase/sulfurtransferase